MLHIIGWAVVAAIVVFSLSRILSARGADRQKARMDAEADRLIAECVLRDDDDTIAKLLRADYLARTAGDGLLASEALSRLGDIYMKRARYDDAARVYEKAITYKQSPGWHADKPNFEALLQRSLQAARAASKA